MLSPTELDRAQRGEDHKRVLRAAAALRGVYSDRALADVLNVSERTINGWWGGAVPGPGSIEELAVFTGMSRRDLTDWLLYDGHPPHLPDPEESEAQERAEAAERATAAPGEGAASEARPAPRGTRG